MEVRKMCYEVAAAVVPFVGDEQLNVSLTATAEV